jgi:type I restriction enzyme, S subunit
MASCRRRGAMPESRGGNTWTKVAFGDVVRLSKERSSDPLGDGLERYVGLEHIKPNDLRIRSWGNIADGTTFTSVFRPGQVLFGKRRAYQRKVSVANFSGVCSGDIYVLEPSDDKLLPELLPFICQTDSFFEHAVGTSAGSLSPRTNWKNLSEYEFALPSLEEQHRIVTALGRIGSTVDDLGTAINAATTLRKAISERFFQEDSSSGCARLSSLITDSMYGPRFSSSLYSDQGELAQLRTTDITEDGYINYNSIPRALLLVEHYGEHILQDGDVLISRSGTTGITAVFHCSDVPTIPAAFLIRLRTDDRLLPRYLHEYLSSPTGRQLTASLSRGGVQKNINGSQLLAQHVPCPSIARQLEVVSNLTSLRVSQETLRNRQLVLRELQKELSSSAFGRKA